MFSCWWLISWWIMWLCLDSWMIIELNFGYLLMMIKSVLGIFQWWLNHLCQWFMVTQEPMLLKFHDDESSSNVVWLFIGCWIENISNWVSNDRFMTSYSWWFTIFEDGHVHSMTRTMKLCSWMKISILEINNIKSLNMCLFLNMIKYKHNY